MKIRGLQRRGQTAPIGGRRRESRQKDDQMKQLALCLALCLSSPALAEIETARDLMDAGDYARAMEELRPAAIAGNAEAEELIGVMYASGLGVERDDVRALRVVSARGDEGACGRAVGGRLGTMRSVAACPRPTLSRAYMWYVLLRHRGRPGCCHLPGGSGEEDDTRTNRKGPCADRGLPGLAVPVPVGSPGAASRSPRTGGTLSSTRRPCPRRCLPRLRRRRCSARRRSVRRRRCSP